MFTSFSKRSDDLEYLDLGPDFYSQEEYNDCMKKLDRIGRWLGGNAATLRAIRNSCSEPDSILDVGCGGGYFTALLARAYPKANVVGIDLSTDAIGFAEKHYSGLENLTFEHRENPRLSLHGDRYDIVTSTLVCHHLRDEQIVTFLQDATHVAKRSVIINDLHRSRLGYVLFAVLAPLLFRNRLIQHDGLLSIKRAFNRNEWREYLAQAGIPNDKQKIHWNWAFRWIVTITK